MDFYLLILEFIGLLTLILVPVLVYRLAQRRYPTHAWAITGLSFGFVAYPVSYAWANMLGGIAPGLFLHLSQVHWQPGFTIAAALGLQEAQDHAMGLLRSHPATVSINALFWSVTYGFTGHVIDRFLKGLNSQAVTPHPLPPIPRRSGGKMKFLALVLLLLLGVLYWIFYPTFQENVTLVSLSPDDKLQVHLVERPRWIDRNFELRLENLKTRKSRTVFLSPDEGSPVGSERIIWSADGSRFLLLGRHFYVTNRDMLSTGEQAYLLMDIRSGKIWCNATQQSVLGRFGLEELRAIKWFNWTPP